jgi:hypothetical protein
MTIRTTLTSHALAATITTGFSASSFADETIELDNYDLTRVDGADQCYGVDRSPATGQPAENQ